MMSHARTSNELRLKGIGVSPGIVHGVAALHSLEEEEPAAYKVEAEQIPKEIARFEAALVATRSQILEMQCKIADAIGARDAGIFDAHLLVVEDRTLIDEVLRSLEQEQWNVEHIFHKVADRYVKTLKELDDLYLRERAMDVVDVTRRVIRNLQGKEHREVIMPDQPHIIISHNLTPSDTATMNRTLVLGFATEVGSKTSHTAIMAASLNLPAVVGLHSLQEKVVTGDRVLLDGYSGTLIINPTKETLAEYDNIEERKELIEGRLKAIQKQPAITKDEKRITLSANIELPDDLGTVEEVGAEGIGLYRTEFFYFNKPEPPDENAQYLNYREIVETVAPHMVIIRTLDTGGDKFVTSIHQQEDEKNPFLGWRAIRFCLENPHIFKPQLRAILRASAHGKVGLLYPMISGLNELKAANKFLEECRQELREEGIPFDEEMQVGTMIEIPSAALTADLLVQEVDFLSIGTNDLIQYTIAVDRLNEKIADLYTPTHPAILRLIQLVVQHAHAAGKWVGVCGEIAAEPLFAPLLLGLGVDEMSTGAALVPSVKLAIRSVELASCQALVEEAMKLDTPEKIHQLCEEFGEKWFPDLMEFCS